MNTKEIIKNAIKNSTCPTAHLTLGKKQLENRTAVISLDGYMATTSKEEAEETNQKARKDYENFINSESVQTMIYELNATVSGCADTTARYDRFDKRRKHPTFFTKITVYIHF